MTTSDKHTSTKLWLLLQEGWKNASIYLKNSQVIFIFTKEIYHKCLTGFQPFKRQPHKMVKHTHRQNTSAKHIGKTHRQKPTNCLSVFDHFVGLALKSLNRLL